MLQGNIVYCHPQMYEQVQKIIKQEKQKESEFIYRPFDIKIIADKYCPKYVDGDGWQAKIKNDRFTEWYKVDDNNTLKEEPASWMIYFGFVKPEQIPGIYLVNTNNTTMVNLTGPSMKSKSIIKDKTPFIPKQGLFE